MGIYQNDIFKEIKQKKIFNVNMIFYDPINKPCSVTIFINDNKLECEVIRDKIKDFQKNAKLALGNSEEFFGTLYERIPGEFYFTAEIGKIFIVDLKKIKISVFSE